VNDIIASIPILDYDLEVAEAHAELLVEVRFQGKPRGAHDLVIAATAKAFDRRSCPQTAVAFTICPGLT
jgi:tRNA(fMet)-specific endonuclease VapC